jgi:hypothetical protein
MSAWHDQPSRVRHDHGVIELALSEAQAGKAPPIEESPEQAATAAVKEWLDSEMPDRAQSRQARIVQQGRKLAADGHTAAQLRVALDYWKAAKLGTAQIPDVLDEVVNGPDALYLDPSRVLSWRDIHDIRGGDLHAKPFEVSYWLRELRCAERMRCEERVKIIEARAARRARA